MPRRCPGRGATRGMQADVAQLVEGNLAQVEGASSSLVVRSETSRVTIRSSTPGLHGGLAERRGNGLQIRVHGFKSRTHLHHTAAPSTARPRAIGAVVARFLDTEEGTGSNPVLPTRTKPQVSDPSGGPRTPDRIGAVSVSDTTLTLKVYRRMICRVD